MGMLRKLGINFSAARAKHSCLLVFAEKERQHYSGKKIRLLSLSIILQLQHIVKNGYIRAISSHKSEKLATELDKVVIHVPRPCPNFPQPPHTSSNLSDVQT